MEANTSNGYDAEIEKLAYRFWEERGRPFGSPEEDWFKAEREGMYYGQCSELCGKDHAFMPIAVRVVSDGDYATWLADAKKKYARNDTPSRTAVAAADTGR